MEHCHYVVVTGVPGMCLCHLFCTQGWGVGWGGVWDTPIQNWSLEQGSCSIQEVLTFCIFLVVTYKDDRVMCRRAKKYMVMCNMAPLNKLNQTSGLIRHFYRSPTRETNRSQNITQISYHCNLQSDWNRWFLSDGAFYKQDKKKASNRRLWTRTWLCDTIHISLYELPHFTYVNRCQLKWSNAVFSFNGY